MLTAKEALAISSLLTPQDFSLHKHLEVRIWDSIQNGGTSFIYAGVLPENVEKAMLALGYHLEIIEDRLTRISWD